jgi:hypothetical protein
MLIAGEDILRAGQKFGEDNASRGRYLSDDSFSKRKIGLHGRR